MGTGGVHLLVEEGNFEVTIYKRDLGKAREGRQDLHAILFAPDHTQVGDVLLKTLGKLDKDGRGPWQKETIRLAVKHPGLYLLQFVLPTDRHGSAIEWSIETTAKKWILETVRGHRDERHREPIIMQRADLATDIIFSPRSGAFEILAEGLPLDATPWTLFDGDGKEVASLPIVKKQSTVVRKHMEMRGTFPEDASTRVSIPAAEKGGRGAKPWRLHIPQSQFYLGVGGLTEWDAKDTTPGQTLWTPVAESWFPFYGNRMLVHPYQRTMYAEQGEEGEITFHIYNDAPIPREFELSVEFPGRSWEVILPENKLHLTKWESREITIRFKRPADGKKDELAAYIRATPVGGEVSSYAALYLREGKSPIGSALELPISLRPYEHEDRQFGYLPQYPVENQTYYDLENRGYVVDRAYYYRESKDGWEQLRFADHVKRVVPDIPVKGWVSVTSKIAFDADNHMYVLGYTRISQSTAEETSKKGDSVTPMGEPGPASRIALLHSTDGGDSFTAYMIDNASVDMSGWDIEQFSGHNLTAGPPPVVRVERISPPRKEGDNYLRWRSVNSIDLIVGEKGANGEIQFHPPVRLTDTALASSFHSGIPSMIVSRGSKTHVVWAEATDPDISRDKIPGVPAYVATYDRDTRVLEKPAFMSFGPPPNDGHNTPSITMDSKGILHVVVGTHGNPFQYLHSLKPNDSRGGWTEATRTSTTEELRQTYVGLVCDSEDTLHLVYRLWRNATGGRWGGANGATLAHQIKKSGSDWEAPQILVEPALPDYSVYYHRLTIDRKGKLFVNFEYWPTSWLYRNEIRVPKRAGSERPGRGWGRETIFSSDNGVTWGLW